MQFDNRYKVDKIDILEQNNNRCAGAGLDCLWYPMYRTMDKPHIEVEFVAEFGVEIVAEAERETKEAA